METPCAYCNQPMANRIRSRARFCSQECKDKARNAARSASLHASRPERFCAACQKPLRPSQREDALTCSKACAWQFQNKVHSAARTAARRANHPPCGSCGGVIPATSRAGSLYCSPACKKKVAGARWREKSPGYMRNYLYGLTTEQYAELLAGQDGKCAVCATDTPGGKGGWHVDHDHATGAVRGLLCHSCNLALGYFHDDPVRILAAMKYLEAHAAS